MSPKTKAFLFEIVIGSIILAAVMLVLFPSEG